jgi:hypothetical protein
VNMGRTAAAPLSPALLLKCNAINPTLTSTGMSTCDDHRWPVHHQQLRRRVVYLSVTCISRRVSILLKIRHNHWTETNFSTGTEFSMKDAESAIERGTRLSKVLYAPWLLGVWNQPERLTIVSGFDRTSSILVLLRDLDIHAKTQLEKGRRPLRDRAEEGGRGASTSTSECCEQRRSFSINSTANWHTVVGALAIYSIVQ